jgi:hypothetical protein
LYHFTQRVIKLTVVIMMEYYCYQLHTKLFPNILLSRLSLYIDVIVGDYYCGFQYTRSTTDQIFCIRQVLEKNESTIRQYISYS